VTESVPIVLDRGRVSGVILGAAIGDALGYPVEFTSSANVRRRFGPSGVTGYVEYWSEGERRFAPYSDDTQMARMVLEVLLASRQLGMSLDDTMRTLAQRFTAWAVAPPGGHRNPGAACLAGCAALAAGQAWYEAGAETAGGCGSVMRVYPVALLHIDDPDRAEGWAIAQSKLTHRSPLAFAACAAFVRGLISLLSGGSLEQFSTAIERTAEKYDRETALRVRTAIDAASSGTPPEVVLQRFLGWAAHDALAAACYVFLRHPQDARRGLLEAANAPGDSDSIATLVGALLGASVGVSGFPVSWLRDLEHSDELCTLAGEVEVFVQRELVEQVPGGTELRIHR